MKSLIILFIILFMPDILSAQNNAAIIDSLIGQLANSREDSNRVTNWQRLSAEYLKKNNYEEALNYGNQAFNLAEKLNFKKGIALGHLNLGLVYKEKGNLPEALNQQQNGLKKSQEIRFKEGIANAYNNIGNIYFLQDNYPEAVKNFLASLKISEQTGDVVNLADAYGSIGNVYKEQGNFPEAMKYQSAYLKLAEDGGNKQNILAGYSNIGNIYLAKNDYLAALSYYSASLKIAKEINDRQEIAYSYGNIGRIYSALGDYKNALENQLASLKIKSEIDDKNGKITSYVNLGNLYTQMSRFEDARIYLMNALSLSEKTGSKEGIKNTYEGLAELENKTGNFEHAFQYYKLFTQIKDGILNEKTNKEISFLKVQYETDKKDQQINNQELRHVFLQTRIYYGLLIGFLIIVIVVVLFYLRNRRFKKEYDHSLVKLELTLLKSQLNPHFVSNSLSAIKAFIDQQPERASQFLSKFARLIRRVLEQSEHPLIALQEELKTVELYMQIESLRLDYGFDYTIRIDPGIDKTDLMVPPLILQPTIENAIWHGLAPKNSRGHILIDIKREHDLLKFTIEDNGEGQKVSKEEVINPLERKSFGLSITRKRIEILSKELKKEGYFNLTFLTGKTVAEMALPVHFH